MLSSSARLRPERALRRRSAARVSAPIRGRSAAQAVMETARRDVGPDDCSQAADVLVPAPADTQGCCLGRKAATPSGPRTSPVDVVGSASALAAQLAPGTTGARGPRSRSGGDGCLRGLSGLSGLTEVGECPCLDRRLGPARGNEPRAELLAASRIIEATWRGEVGFGRLDVSRLPDGLDERCLVLVLELLHGGEGDYLGRVQAAAIPYLLADPACGVVEDRRRSHGALGVPPAIGLLPHLGDLLRRGCLPPSGIEHRL